MTRPIDIPSLYEVIGWLNELREEIAAATRRLAEADEMRVMAREAEEMAKARVFIELGDKGTVAWREAQATIRTERERLTRVVAEQQYRAAKEQVRDLRDQLDAVRSVNATVNTEWRTQAMGQPA